MMSSEGIRSCSVSAEVPVTCQAGSKFSGDSGAGPVVGVGAAVSVGTSGASVADVYLVTCTTDPELVEDGIALIYVPADTPGISFSKPENKMGMRFTDVNASIYLDDVRVPREYRASAEAGKDFQSFRNFLSWGRLSSAAFAVGAAFAGMAGSKLPPDWRANCSASCSMNTSSGGSSRSRPSASRAALYQDLDVIVPEGATNLHKGLQAVVASGATDLYLITDGLPTVGDSRYAGLNPFAACSSLLLALFYLVIDVWKVSKWAFFFVVIGMNPITIYMATGIIDFWHISEYFFGGFARVEWICR